MREDRNYSENNRAFGEQLASSKTYVFEILNTKGNRQRQSVFCSKKAWAVITTQCIMVIPLDARDFV
jgi:hypothetical protein